MKRFAIHGPLLTVILVLVGCGGEKTGVEENSNIRGTKIDHSSPETIAASFKSAMSNKEWSKGVACMDQDSNKVVVMMMGLGASFTAASDKTGSKKQSLDNLIKKHGLEKGMGKEGLKNVKDIGALAADLLKWVEENAPPNKNGSMAQSIGQTEFSDFKIDGNSATAATVGKNAKRETAYFKKIDGEWYVDLATMIRKMNKASPFIKDAGTRTDPNLKPVVFNIPDRPISGTIHGQRFQPDKFELDGRRLLLSAGKDFFPDFRFQVSLRGQGAPEPPDGKTYEINVPLKFGTPSAHLRWKVSGKKLGDNAMINKYALKVVFGQRTVRRITGRIHFRSLEPGDDKTEFSGSFTAEISADLSKPPTELDAPYIHGTITVKNEKEFKLSAGMTGFIEKGKKVWNSAGTRFSKENGGGSVASTTFKPQITALRSDENGAVSYRHISLKPGLYLAYVMHEKRFAAWKWIEVGEKDRIAQDFAIDSTQHGNLEVKTDGAVGNMVSLTPLRKDGTLPMGADKVSVSFGLNLSKPANVSTVFQNLPVGRFRVLYRGKTGDVEIEAGKTTKLTYTK